MSNAIQDILNIRILDQKFREVLHEENPTLIGISNEIKTQIIKTMFDLCKENLEYVEQKDWNKVEESVKAKYPTIDAEKFIGILKTAVK